MYGSNMFQLYTLQTLQKPFAPQLPCEITVPLDKLIDTLSGKQVLRAKSSFNRGTRIKQQQESGMAWTLVSICICHSPWYKACTRSLTFSGLLDHVPAPHSALKQSFWPVSLACDILWLSRKFKCVHQQACILFLQSNSKAFFKRHQKRPERNQSHLSNSNHPKSRLNPRTL